MINHDEERRLREIERSLERDDPAFAARIRTIQTAKTSPLVRCATRLTIVGLVVTIIGFLTSPTLAATGVLLAVTGLALHLAVSAFTQTVRLRGDSGEPSTGDDSART